MLIIFYILSENYIFLEVWWSTPYLIGDMSPKKSFLFTPSLNKRVFQYLVRRKEGSCVRKDLQQRSQFTDMVLPCEIPQLDIPDMWAEIIFYNFFSFHSVNHFSTRDFFIQLVCFAIFSVLSKDNVFSPISVLVMI